MNILKANDIPKKTLNSLHATANYILSVQLDNGAIPWFKEGKLDPWDHTEAAMALCCTGHHKNAEDAYYWLAKNQLEDGSWHANYNNENNYKGATLESDIIETNFVAYIATGVWHQYLITGNNNFLEKMYSCVNSAMTFVLSHQSQYGEIAWAVDTDGKSKNDALITACSSILRSLDCAIKISQALNIDSALWQISEKKLHNALHNKPERFDRTWESKARFSMDWYYPILAGMYSPNDAKKILENRWQEFVVDDLGCRCVSDEPWVTMAETCELVMALIACDEKQKALSLFKTLDQWRDADGGYWTGYVFRDKEIWPEEKTTWTAGAVILAADSIYDLTPAAQLFSQPLFS